MSDQVISCVPGVEEIRQRHLKWRGEHEAWISEVQKWRREQEEAVVLLHKLDRAIPNHGAALQEHFDTIKAHEDQLMAHDDALNYISAGNMGDDEYKRLVESHQEGALRHDQMREKHKTFHRVHQTAMKELRNLVKELRAD